MGNEVLILQHAACEHAGNIAAALQRANRHSATIELFAGQNIPDEMDSFSALVVMGGPMGVYEEAKYPFIRDELRLITQALEHKKPIVGICLGSQLLAAALGAKVYPGPKKEIGWYQVSKLPGAKGDALTAGLPESFMAMHWHGDVFDVPAGAVPLLRSDLTACQAFRFDRNAYGFLCHLELSFPQIDRMVQAFPAELKQAGISDHDILQGWPMYGATLERLGGEVFSRWTALLK
ncbi:MAG: type 1 glutamine amidotransferase [Phycisphaerae bacterium]